MKQMESFASPLGPQDADAWSLGKEAFSGHLAPCGPRRWRSCSAARRCWRRSLLPAEKRGTGEQKMRTDLPHGKSRWCSSWKLRPLGSFKALIPKWRFLLVAGTTPEALVSPASQHSSTSEASAKRLWAALRQQAGARHGDYLGVVTAGERSSTSCPLKLLSLFQTRIDAGIAVRFNGMPFGLSLNTAKKSPWLWETFQMRAQGALLLPVSATRFRVCAGVPASMSGFRDNPPCILLGIRSPKLETPKTRCRQNDLRVSKDDSACDVAERWRELVKDVRKPTILRQRLL